MNLKDLYNPLSRSSDLLLPFRKKKRVGRGIGSGHGKTSSRGSKGQWASAGAKKPTQLFEGGQMQLFRRMPKRGFSHESWNIRWAIVNIKDLENCFHGAEIVDRRALKKHGLAKGPISRVRVLGEGLLSKALTVRVDDISTSAQAKILAAGGHVELVPGPRLPVRNKMKSSQS